MRKVLALAFVGFVAVLALSPPAMANVVRCGAPFEPDVESEPQILGAVTVGTVIVPSGTFCVLDGTEVTGDVRARPGSRLLTFGADVAGSATAGPGAELGLEETAVGDDLNCDGCTFEDAIASSIGGSMRISGESQGSFIIESEIAGDLVISSSAAGDFTFLLLGNTIGGKLLFTGNSGSAGIIGNVIGKSLAVNQNDPSGGFCPDPEDPEAPCYEGLVIADNEVGTTLTCQGNDPAPTGGGNTAQRKLGQCSGL